MIAVALALAAAAPPALQPLQFLVGHCWRTTLKEGPTDTHCFASVAAGQQIRDRHAIRKDGQVVYMLERHQIEGRNADDIAKDLRRAFDKYCETSTVV